MSKMFTGPYLRPPYSMDKCQITESKFLNLVNELLMEQLIVAHKGRIGFQQYLCFGYKCVYY